jgi:SAM-dependent methyltransferase
VPWLPPLSANAWLRYDLVQRLLPEGIGDVLEIGCGRGGFAARFARRYRYVGLEPDPLSYAVARERLVRSGGRGEVRNGDVSRVGTDERFDLVCAFEVIEHVEDDEVALAEWVSHIRPGGWLLLSTPAWQHRFAAADTLAGHFRRYDPSVLQSRLDRAGLRNSRTVQYGGPLGYALEAGRNLLARWGAWDSNDASVAVRTHRSGRWLQPDTDAIGTVIRLACVPFLQLQHLWPDTGPGIIALGQLPMPPFDGESLPSRDGHEVQ